MWESNWVPINNDEVNDWFLPGHNDLTQSHNIYQNPQVPRKWSKILRIPLCMLRKLKHFEQDQGGMLPFHILVCNPDATAQLIMEWFDINPLAAFEQDRWGRMNAIDDLHIQFSYLLFMSSLLLLLWMLLLLWDLLPLRLLLLSRSLMLTLLRNSLSILLQTKAPSIFSTTSLPSILILISHAKIKVPARTNATRVWVKYAWSMTLF